MTLPIDIAKLKPDQIRSYADQLEKNACERSLYQFVRKAWKYIDPSAFEDNWALEALCLHLEQVTYGNIRRLLCNYPPRCAKSNISSICWPAWTWIQKHRSVTSGPKVRFLTASYGDALSLKGSSGMRTLVESPWFQKHWGDIIKLRSDQNTKSDFANTEGGNRQSTSITGRLIGFGGDITLCDDPHNTDSAESEAERENVLRGWKELSTTRLNNPKKSAIVVVMQRLHEQDVSGDIISKNDGDWVHLMIPMRHDVNRHCVTYIPGDGEPFWEDPREEDGELMWPERFGEREVEALEIGLGPYMASGRLQQSPTPAGGGIIKREFWELWQGPLDTQGREQFPMLEYVAAFLDTAFTEKEENDYCAMTVWGLWYLNGVPKLILLNGWKKRLTLHGPPFDESAFPNWDSMPKMEKEKILRQHCGVVEWANHTARRFNVDRLLIENKASGIDVANEMQRLYRDAPFMVQLIDPKRKDKVARAHAVVPMFADKMIYAPERDWADMVITECASFPKGAHDDVVDTVTGALLFFRESNMAMLRSERLQEEEALKKFRPKTKPLYPV